MAPASDELAAAQAALSAPQAPGGRLGATAGPVPATGRTGATDSHLVTARWAVAAALRARTLMDSAPTAPPPDRPLSLREWSVLANPVRTTRPRRG